MDTRIFINDFVDLVVPKLDTTELSIYLYVVRHSWLEGKESIIVSISNAAKSNSFGLGNKGGTMGISATRNKVYTLEKKGFVKVIDSTYSGLRIKPILPWDVPDLKRQSELDKEKIPMEKLDFYSDPFLRMAILKRENNRCFYSFQKITEDNFVIDHVVSKPNGDNSYMNLVATTKAMNSKKDNMTADDFLRVLYRDGLLSEDELTDRLDALERLKAGHSKPMIDG